MVSRDDLIEQCWGGRIVGEDAITGALAQLRKLAKSLGGFEIETVPRVGVRLVEHLSEGPPIRREATHVGAREPRAARHPGLGSGGLGVA
jgi:DNA-binding winged helix-turn-helix (wHTH) protein